MSRIFVVREINRRSETQTVSYQAKNRQEVIDKIRSKGHAPIHIEESKGTQIDLFADFNLLPSRVSTKDLAVFCKQMSTMLHAGMPLIDSLDVIKEQSDNKKMRRVAEEMTNHVKKGEILSVAMKNHRDVFPNILINMIETGELSGNIDTVLEKMTDHYMKENKINAKVRGAMIYPMFIGVIAVFAVIFLITFVMPTFIEMFENAGSELPGITKMLLALSDFIRQYWWMLIIGVSAAIYGLRRYFATDRGKTLYDHLLLKLPGIKGPIAKIATSRFTRTLAMLLSSGVPLIESLQSSANVTNNKIVVKGIDRVADDIKKGKSLSRLLKSIAIFPPMMISMIKIGEESGSLEEMLDKSAEFYEEELEEAIKNLTSLIEPAMIVIMAGMVGFIVVGMLLPIFDMFQTIQ